MKTVIEMAREAGFVNEFEECAAMVWVQDTEITEIIEHLVEIVREETNARANASWTLMCEKMVAIEREACAQFLESTNLAGLPEDTALHYARLLKGFAEGIRVRGNT